MKYLGILLRLLIEVLLTILLLPIILLILLWALILSLKAGSLMKDSVNENENKNYSSIRVGIIGWLYMIKKGLSMNLDFIINGLEK